METCVIALIEDDENDAIAIDLRRREIIRVVVERMHQHPRIDPLVADILPVHDSTWVCPTAILVDGETSEDVAAKSRSEIEIGERRTADKRTRRNDGRSVVETPNRSRDIYASRAVEHSAIYERGVDDDIPARWNGDPLLGKLRGQVDVVVHDLNEDFLARGIRDALERHPRRSCVVELDDLITLRLRGSDRLRRRIGRRTSHGDQEDRQPKPSLHSKHLVPSSLSFVGLLCDIFSTGGNPAFSVPIHTTFFKKKQEKPAQKLVFLLSQCVIESIYPL